MEQKSKVISWWFEDKSYITVRCRYIHEFNVQNEPTPCIKIFKYWAEKFVIKGFITPQIELTNISAPHSRVGRVPRTTNNHF